MRFANDQRMGGKGRGEEEGRREWRRVRLFSNECGGLGGRQWWAPLWGNDRDRHIKSLIAAPFLRPDSCPYLP